MENAIKASVWHHVGCPQAHSKLGEGLNLLTDDSLQSLPEFADILAQAQYPITARLVLVLGA